ncbi:uncharacterized protein with LysM domain [Psychrobacter sp. JCM 18900]|nr:uncharacterized protein with LysM domain [Psychrobacter sp. JCM 18900]
MLMTTAHANNPPPTIKADAPNRYIVKKRRYIMGYLRSLSR